METINNVELRDENVYPSEEVLSAVLENSFKAYLSLLEVFTNNDMTCEWRYYRDGKAWLCKVQKKKRTIVWMSAWKGFMQAAIYFPERYMEEVYSLDISEELKEKFKSTKNVGKSKPCIFQIQDKNIFGDFEKMMNLKIKCK